MSRFHSHGLSDIGISRSNNEDVWLALPEMGFFALADGMGGHQAGEVAAKETIEFLSQSIRSLEPKSPMEVIIQLRHAIEETNAYVFKMGQAAVPYFGMGTTLCCLLWTEEMVVYAHVGDSRVYRFRSQRLELLTEDHSLFAQWLATGKLAEECKTPYPYKNVITRAIGTGEKANPEIAVCTPHPSDLYLLCTDGLSDVLTLEDIETVLKGSSDLQLAAEHLIQKAKIKGSSDNMTVLLIQKKGF